MSRSKHQQAVLDRYWNGLIVMDAPMDMGIHITDQHRDDGIPGDESRCSTALCIRDSLGSQYVVVFRTVAYADIEDPRWGRRVWRWTVSRALRSKVIERLDGGLEPIPGVYVLQAPTASESLEGIRRKNARVARVTGRRVRHPGMKAAALIPGRPGYLRSGAGMVHFTRPL